MFEDLVVLRFFCEGKNPLLPEIRPLHNNHYLGKGGKRERSTASVCFPEIYSRKKKER